METTIATERSSAGVIQTTLGDLVAAITEVALRAGNTEREGYKLASLTLEKMLRERRTGEIQ